MGVRAKAKQKVSFDIDEDIKRIIRKGQFSEEDKKPEKEQVRFTLYVSKDICNLIDESRAQCVGKKSRNQWILEAIAEKIESENTPSDF